MAEIQKRTETVVKSFYRLDLDYDEAKFLADLVGCVGGYGKGRRRHAEEIARVLKSAGVDHGDWDSGRYVPIADMQGSVMMVDDS